MEGSCGPFKIIRTMTTHSTETPNVAIDRFALGLGIVSFDANSLPKDPEQIKRVLEAGAKLAKKHFMGAKAAGII